MATQTQPVSEARTEEGLKRGLHSRHMQMTAIGEESGSLDHMLGKAAEFYEDEVDEAVKSLSSLMEPFIIVILGTLID